MNPESSTAHRDTVTKMREQCPNILKMQMMRVDATEVREISSRFCRIFVGWRVESLVEGVLLRC